MSQFIDLSFLKFLLSEVHCLDEILEKERYAEHEKESLELFLDSVKDLAEKDYFPVFQEMDDDPVRFEDGKIIAHPAVGKAMRTGGEMGLMSSAFDFKDGGLQMPMIVHTVAHAILEAANNHLPGYMGLTLGAAELIVHFGSEELKEKYVGKMIGGEWGGTMCLTEPQAGSSLSDILTTAYPAEDGTYRIKGQKIFISGGDHAYCDNFVHLVLARIEGAPAGTKGISLFVVPKNRINEDGSLSFNDVTTAGDFQKMGQKGYCTTHLIFGEADDCHGWLVGEPHRGLPYMFQMMNGARIAVGRGAAAIASAAYHASLAYAKERPQGRRISNSGNKNLAEGQTLIINHPDVRRMIYLQKAISEGAMSLVLQAAEYHDRISSATTPEEKEKYDLLLELLTPVVKTYPSEAGRRSVDNGVQVLGGYGFCTEYILQLYLRDIRIFAIYEGTTGIQSLDLLGRKMMLGNGKAVKLLTAEIMETIQSAMSHDDLKPYAQSLGNQLGTIKKVMDFLTPFAAKGEYERFLSDATVFMELFGTVVVGWQWLKIGVRSKMALLTNDQKRPHSFYEDELHAMKFYFKYEIPKTSSLAEILMDETVLTLANEKEASA